MRWMNPDRCRYLIFAVSLITLASLASLGLAQPPGPPHGPPRHARGESVELKGNVQSYNRNPHGAIDSVMLTVDDKPAQINFPADLSAAIGEIAKVSDSVSVTAERLPSRSDHAVYRLIRLAGADGKEVRLWGPEESERVQVSSTIKQLNYAPHGELNGVLLENGDFVHLGPAGADAVEPKVGAQLDVEGRLHVVAAGSRTIEAEQINGEEIERRPPPPRRDRRGFDGPPPPRGGFDGPPPPHGGRDFGGPPPRGDRDGFDGPRSGDRRGPPRERDRGPRGPGDEDADPR